MFIFLQSAGPLNGGAIRLEHSKCGHRIPQLSVGMEKDFRWKIQEKFLPEMIFHKCFIMVSGNVSVRKRT